MLKREFANSTHTEVWKQQQRRVCVEMEGIYKEFVRENLTEQARTELDHKVRCVESFINNLSIHEPECPGIAFITSGGTVVPLEVNAVRYLTNFSSGGRGAYFVEAFAKRNWCCVLLHHRDAVKPFRRIIDFLSTEELFELISRNNMETLNNKCENSEETRVSKDKTQHCSDYDASKLGNTSIINNNNDNATISTCTSNTNSQWPTEIIDLIRLYRQSKHLVITISFHTVVEYIYLLEQISITLCTLPLSHPLSHKPLLFFAAAAVLDYFVPLTKLSENKISVEGGVDIHLDAVPKVLGLLQDKWLVRCHTSLPAPFTVTFKLETTDARMRSKAINNLHKYECNAVVANMLQTYKDHVYVYLRDATKQEDPLYVKRDDANTIESQLADIFIAQVT